MFELKLLEYEKILNILKEYAYINKTKKAIMNLEPTVNKDSILKMLNEAYEAKNILFRLGDIDLYDFDLDFTIDRIRIGSTLNINEFVELRKMMIDSTKIKDYLVKASTLDVVNETLLKYIDNFKSLKEIRQEINTVIDVDGNINDTASSTLFNIRKNIRSLESESTNKLNSLMKTLGNKLAEPIITIRNGHRVIPIKSEYKSQVKGIIFDESQSGLAVYIEPLEVSQIDGRIVILKNEERNEISRILKELSDKTSLYYDDIYIDLELVYFFDNVFARGKYAKEIDAEIPIISDTIELIDARHPLIDKNVIVPNTIYLENKNTMIITGPNTGGKTVVLKTLGLLSLMTQSGILIPVKEGSKIKIFSGIYADIGDEQSIEQSLSTFSSHMTRIVRILDEVEEDSLVVLDELGSGTDPKEGASLAISILNFLRRIKAYTVCTTHYPELKLYAYQNSDILNASVEFDCDSLKPTYKLLIGISGKSNAFLISRRLGLNENIIAEAEGVNLEFKDEQSLLIQNLERESLYLKNEREKYDELTKKLEKEIKENREYLKNEKARLHKRMDDLTDKENEVLEKAQKEANDLIDEIKELKKNVKNNNDIKDNVLIDLKGRTNKLYKDKYVKKNFSKKEIQVGDNVKIIDFNQVGKVIAIKNDKYNVQFGSMSSFFLKTDLELVEIVDNIKEATLKNNTPSNLKINKSMRLDLRGMRYEEALEALDKFMDDAVMTSLTTVEIIHGFGTLALRKMVIDYCKSHSNIKSYRSGEEHEGGRGVTVIDLK